MPIIDIHTHFSPPRPPGDRFGVVEALRGTPVGKNTVTNYRGLPAVSYHEMSDFELQQETCAQTGITRRIISTPFAAELMAAISQRGEVFFRSKGRAIACHDRGFAGLPCQDVRRV